METSAEIPPHTDPQANCTSPNRELTHQRSDENVLSIRRLADPQHSATDRCAIAKQMADTWLRATEGLLGKVKQTLMSGETEAVCGIIEAVKFLCLVASDRSRSWTPSHRVDLVWHEMILFTRSYSYFCQLEFGEFIHHQPSDDHGKNQQAFTTTLTAYRNWFGEPDDRFWGNRNHALATCGPCDAGV